MHRDVIAVFPILADPDRNNLQSAQLLIGREVVSGRMDGCRASVLHSCSCRDRPKLGRLQYFSWFFVRHRIGEVTLMRP